MKTVPAPLFIESFGMTTGLTQALSVGTISSIFIFLGMHYMKDGERAERVQLQLKEEIQEELPLPG